MAHHCKIREKTVCKIEIVCKIREETICKMIVCKIREEIVCNIETVCKMIKETVCKMIVCKIREVVVCKMTACKVEDRHSLQKHGMYFVNLDDMRINTIYKSRKYILVKQHKKRKRSNLKEHPRPHQLAQSPLTKCV